MTSAHRSNEEINQMMARVAPELASEYAKYPLERTHWYNPNDKGPKGEPCYVAPPSDNNNNKEMKMDYVYGAGPYGFGYYSLLTIHAYKNLYARISNEAPMSCGTCCMNKEARKVYDEYDDVQRILYNRSIASIPNDKQAAADAIAVAQGVAQNWHQGLQNEQLAFNIVNAVNR